MILGSQPIGAPQSAAVHVSEFWTKYRKDIARGVSKYVVLRDALMGAIASGHWKQGAQLPTEQELARATPFSLGTVQRALRSLADEGVIVRRQGHGTFVAENAVPLDRPWHMRFLPPDGKEIVPTYTYALARKDVTGEGRWSRFFPSKNDLFCIERRFRIADEFWVYNRFYGSAGVLGPLRKIALNKLNGVNLKELIGKQYNLPITAIEHRLRTVHFDPAMCENIEVKKGSTGLLLEAVARTGPDAVYFQEYFVPESEYYLDLPSAYQPG